MSWTLFLFSALRLFSAQFSPFASTRFFVSIQESTAEPWHASAYMWSSNDWEQLWCGMATNVWPAMRTITNEDEEENRKMFVANSPNWREKNAQNFSYRFHSVILSKWRVRGRCTRWESNKIRNFRRRKTKFRTITFTSLSWHTRMVRWFVRWRPHKPRQTVRSIEYEKLRCRSRERCVLRFPGCLLV